eukprot:362998_1
MMRLLNELHNQLIQANKKGLKERVDYLLGVFTSFESLLKHLSTINTKREQIVLRQKWNMIRLSMICVRACPFKKKQQNINNHDGLGMQGIDDDYNIIDTEDDSSDDDDGDILI